MKDNETLKQQVCEAIDSNSDYIIHISDHIMKNPETGYREENTAKYVRDQFERMDLACESGLAVTGVKTRMRGGSSGPSVAILGELDSLIVRGHPYADSVTSAAHACGHNAQVASMLGAGLGLQTVMHELDGDVVLLATPAEECIEVEWRLGLRDQGVIEFLTGKAELIRQGAFDDIDMAMITHTPHETKFLASVGDSHNGALIKRVKFQGRAAHAGASPWLGINALKAAMLALAGIDAQRETFRETDCVRVHPIITRGGEATTAVPADVRMEMLVRARSVEALQDVSEKVDRALRAGGMAMGAEVEILTVAGYLPHTQDPNLVELMRSNCVRVVGDANVGEGSHVTGSTDMGDLSFIMPVVHPRSGGTVGGPHSKTYFVKDHYLAAVNAAKFMACCVVDLLHDDAAGANRVMRESRPLLSRQEFIELRRSFDNFEHFRG